MQPGRVIRRMADRPTRPRRAGWAAPLFALLFVAGACSRNPTPQVYPPPPPPPPPQVQVPAEPDHLRLFQTGLQAIADGRFADAIEFMKGAIRADGIERAELRVTLPDGRTAPYLPHHFLAVALADLGDCRGAFVAWEESLRQGAVQRTQEMERLVDRRQACAASLPQAAAAPPEPRDPAAREQRDRAEAELAEATAAARRADQIEGLRAARQRNAELNRQWDHAESLLAGAHRAFATALAAGDAAAFDRVREQSAAARQLYEDLVSQAHASPSASPSGTPRPPGPTGSAPQPQERTDPEPVVPPVQSEQGHAPAAGGPGKGAGSSAGAPAQPETQSAVARTSTMVRWILLGTGVALLAAVLGVALLVPHPTPFQYVVFRTTLSLAATCVAASIPWLMSVSDDVQQAGSIGGALAVFVIVYFLDPIGRRGPQASVPAGIATLPGVGEACIFLSYRRTESEDVVGRLHAALVATFGDEAIFKDVDDVTLGADYRKVLREAVGSCRVILAVIGPTWEEVRNDRGGRRIDDLADWVRIEIASALERDIPVVPILVKRDRLPAADHLPGDLRELVYRQAIQLRPDPDFDNDVARLVANLHRLLETARS